jgi:hypothetical protein
MEKARLERAFSMQPLRVDEVDAELLRQRAK